MWLRGAPGRRPFSRADLHQLLPERPAPGQPELTPSFGKASAPGKFWKTLEAGMGRAWILNLQTDRRHCGHGVMGIGLTSSAIILFPGSLGVVGNKRLPPHPGPQEHPDSPRQAHAGPAQAALASSGRSPSLPASVHAQVHWMLCCP